MIFLWVSQREWALRWNLALISKDLGDNSQPCERIFVLVLFSVLEPM